MWSLIPEEMTNDSEIKARQDFDKDIITKIGSFDDEYFHFDPDDELEENMSPSDENQDNPAVEATTATEPDLPDITQGPDPLLQATVLLTWGDRAEVATVKHQKRNNKGNFIGRKHKIPTLDSRIYGCEFPDGEISDVSYNTIAEHIFTQCNSEWYQYQIFQEIVHHRRNKNAVDKGDQMVQVGNKLHKKKAVAGWDFQGEWKDGSTSWLSLKDLKNANSVDVTLYAK